VVSSKLKIAVQMDPLEQINFASDSTWQILLEGQFYGEIYYYTPKSLNYREGRVEAFVQKLSIKNELSYTLGEIELVNLTDMDLIFFRQDPPYDMNYLTTSYILEKIQDKVLIINNPKAVRDFPEKISVLDFAQFTPKTLITNNFDSAKNFAKNFNKIVVKPLYGFAGRDVFAFNCNEIKFKYFFDDLVFVHQSPLVVQEFIENVSFGDKRIILINGEPEGFFLRIPEKNSIRSNLAQGGEAVKTELTTKDLEICRALKTFLQENDLFFVGIDVIDGFLTEINTTSPTGLVQAKQFSNPDIVKVFWKKLISLLHHKRKKDYTL
jgi:glutathione synthase